MRLIVVGTGGMAKNHVEHFARIPGVEIVGAVDTDRDEAHSLRRYVRYQETLSSLDEALAWGEFDAATNVTPDSGSPSDDLAAACARASMFSARNRLRRITTRRWK